jgi:hypothetical protein
VREDAMAAPVPRQKINLPSVHLAADEGVGRFAKWRFDSLLSRVFNALHLIKATPTNNANGRCISIHFLRR